MIKRMIVKNFTSLRRIDITLGPLNLFIGANASGKANLLEVLRVVEGVGNGLTIDQVLNGRPRTATCTEWEGIRGGNQLAYPIGLEGTETTIELHGSFPETETAQGRGKTEQADRMSACDWEFLIRFSAAEARVTRQRFKVNSGVHEPDQITDFAQSVGRALAKFQALKLETAVLRQYSEQADAQRIGDRGEEFASLMQTICSNQRTKAAYLTWLRAFCPGASDDVGVEYAAEQKLMFALREKGHNFPAAILSDGTLRFAALAAAFLQPDMPSLLTIQGLDNGIHPTRAKVLLELLRSQAEVTNTQVVATTRSAAVLNWLNEADYRTTFVCKREPESGQSYIHALSEVPHFLEVVKTTALSDLVAEGWLEAAAR